MDCAVNGHAFVLRCRSSQARLAIGHLDGNLVCGGVIPYLQTSRVSCSESMNEGEV
jgi:hypothetical protein